MEQNVSNRGPIKVRRLWRSGIALLALSILNLLAFVIQARHVDFRYWGDGFGIAVLLIFAVALPLVEKWWGYLIASLISAPMVGWFCYIALKVHDVLPVSSDEREIFGDSSSWRQFVIWNHPEILAHNILAAVVLVFAVIGLSRSVFNQRRAFHGGG